MRVLIADDDRVSAAALAGTLRQWRFDVTAAHDGTAAWELLQEQRPAMAIVDWMMPGMDGPTICRHIRREPLLAGTYVIVLTSRDSTADLVVALEAGADDYVVKPFNRDELRARVQVGARVATLQSRLAERVTELQDALAKITQLEGLLPICSYCKRIRTSEAQWDSIEQYVSERSQAEFTHGVCPSCFERVLHEDAAQQV